MVAASALLAVALANRIALVRDLRAGHFGDVVARAEDADDFVSGSSAIFVLTQFAIVVLFIIWMFRAAKNNEALGRTSPRFSPGWSIGAWFIPLANFVIPVLIMQDLWRGSDPATRRGVTSWRAAPASALVGCWWAALLASLVRFSYSGSGLHDSSLDDIETTNTVALVGVVATAIAAILAVLVVRAVSRRQLECLREQRSEYEAGVTAV
jgi:TRAP-type C4-dicarboxylate transport system permease large subunit